MSTTRALRIGTMPIGIEVSSPNNWERVYERFPAAQVHVIESESFFADPYAVYRGLVTFLELDPWVPDLIDQHNARPGSAMPEQARAFLTEHYREHDAALAELVGRRPAWTTR